jgi:ParB family chromosome partitioning protein
MPVPCRVINGSTDAAEISLTENVVRAPMHPADQFDGFRELIDNGATPADIAARFGSTEAAVKKRL